MSRSAPEPPELNLHQLANYPLEGKSIIAYTDGACSGNPGAGSWGVVAEVWKGGKIEKRFEGFGVKEKTTNNQMELMGVIGLLNFIPEKQPITIYTDSKYVKNGITIWVHKWKANGWRLSTKRPVKNLELWRALDTLNSNREVMWSWVKGHSTNKGNNRADYLAVSALKNFQKNSQ